MHQLSVISCFVKLQAFPQIQESGQMPGLPPTPLQYQRPWSLAVLSSFTQTLHELSRHGTDSNSAAPVSFLHPPHIRACFLIEHFGTDSLNLPFPHLHNPFTKIISDALSWEVVEEKMRQPSGAFATKCYRKEPIVFVMSVFVSRLSTCNLSRWTHFQKSLC
jgi:hypothetical protein